MVLQITQRDVNSMVWFNFEQSNNEIYLKYSPEKKPTLLLLFESGAIETEDAFNLNRYCRVS